MRFFKPKGFFPPERHLEIEKASDSCMAIVSRIPVPFESEEHRQIGLSAFGDLVETALEESLPDNLNLQWTQVQEFLLTDFIILVKLNLLIEIYYIRFSLFLLNFKMNK